MLNIYNYINLYIYIIYAWHGGSVSDAVTSEMETTTAETTATQAGEWTATGLHYYWYILDEKLKYHRLYHSMVPHGTTDTREFLKFLQLPLNANHFYVN